MSIPFAIDPAKPREAPHEAFEGGRQPSVSAATKRKALQEKLIEEVAEYLLEHGGPDKEQRAHPSGKRLPADLLSQAIERAESRGLPPGFRVYHFPGTNRMYSDETVVVEVLVKKFESLLRGKFDGNLGGMLAQVGQEDLLSPFVEVINGHSYEVSMLTVGIRNYGGSPYQIAMAYLEAKGLSEDWRDFKPYHMAISSNGTFNDKKIVEELLIKKMGRLLVDKFNGNLGEMLAQLNQKDLLSPFVEVINGHSYEVSMLSVGGKYADSPYQMAMAYLEAKGLSEDWRDFKSYHMAIASIGTFNDKKVVEELLIKKMDRLLVDKFNGNLGGMLSQFRNDDLLSPFVEVINGNSYEVSMRSVGGKYADSPYQMAMAYLEAKGLSEDWRDFKPYHMAISSNGTFNDKKIVKELLIKKMDFILNSKFNGNLWEMLSQINQEDLLSPFVEVINGHSYEVSMLTVGTKNYGGSPFQIAMAYLEAKGLSEDWRDFKPYHMAISSMGTFNDKKVVEELLIKKMDRLLVDKFNGNLGEMLAQLNQKDLRSPLVEVINGFSYEVSMLSVGKKYGGSPYQMAMAYLEAKGLSEDWRDFKPYHMAFSSFGTFNDKKVVEELLIKKMDFILNSKFNGNLGEMLAQLKTEDLLSPFVEVVNGHSYEVCMETVRIKNYGGSPYQIAMAYLEAKGLSEDWRDFKPYHMAISSMGTFNDKKVVEELLIKKMDRLLVDKFNGNLEEMLAQINQKDLLSPFVEVINGHSYEVSMLTVGITNYAGSPYQMAMAYLEAKGLSEDWRDFKSYHRAIASIGTFNDKKVVEELLIKKMDRLLVDKFNGNLGGMLAQINQKDLLSPFVEVINGHSYEVSMLTVGIKNYGGSPYQIAMAYLEAKGLSEDWRDFKPYHMAMSSLGTFDDKKIVEELLIKKMDRLLVDKFNGNLGEMLAQINVDDLRSPLVEVINGHSYEVSMRSVGNKYADSPYQMAMAYLEAKGLSEDWRDFKSYHRAIASIGTFNDKKVVEELLIKKMDFILNSKFNGNLGEMLAQLKTEDLLSPFVEVVNGHSYDVCMSTVGKKYAKSPYQMLKEYAQLKRISFPYSAICFIGSPETRARRLRGELSPYDLKVVKTKQGKYDLQRFGTRLFDARDKDVIRNIMAEAALDIFEDKPIRYLGLESERFESYQLLFNELNVESTAATVVEKDQRIFRIMQSLQGQAKNGLKKSLDGVQIVHSDINDFIATTNRRYNVVNLDYVGHLSKGKLDGLDALLRRGVAEDDTLLFVTLDDRKLAHSRAQTSDQQKELVRVLNSAALEHGWNVQELGSTPYNGGTNGKNSTPMMFSMFRLRKSE